MGIHLSGLVGSIATLPAILAVLLRKQAPLPVTLVLWHVALTGFAVSLAASNVFAAHSTSLLGKVCGCFSLSFCWTLLLWCLLREKSLLLWAGPQRSNRIVGLAGLLAIPSGAALEAALSA